jgi:hypothetical protein
MKLLLAVLFVAAALASAVAAEPEVPFPGPGEEVTDKFATKLQNNVTGQCQFAVKESANNLRWTYGWLTLAFPRVDKRVAPDNTVTLYGDEAEAQNRLGNWVRVNYSCTVSLEDLKAGRTRAEGRDGRVVIPMVRRTTINPGRN